MKSIILIGGGGHCHSCIDVIETGGFYKVAGIVERKGYETSTDFDYPLLGYDEDLPVLLKKYQSALLTVGQIKNSNIRSRLYSKLKDLGANLPSVISPHSYVSSNAKIYSGSIVMHGAIVNTSSLINENCIINSQALIEHNVVIGKHCHISTGSKINGDAIIESGVFIGSGAIIREGVRIGSDSVIGAGTVVLKDLPSRTILRGNK